MARTIIILCTISKLLIKKCLFVSYKLLRCRCLPLAGNLWTLIRFGAYFDGRLCWKPSWDTSSAFLTYASSSLPCCIVRQPSSSTTAAEHSHAPTPETLSLSVSNECCNCFVMCSGLKEKGDDVEFMSYTYKHVSRGVPSIIPFTQPCEPSSSWTNETWWSLEQKYAVLWTKPHVPPVSSSLFTTTRGSQWSFPPHQQG